MSAVLLVLSLLIHPGPAPAEVAAARHADRVHEHPAQDLLDAGRTAYHTGEHAAAGRFLEQALASDPEPLQRADALHLLGLTRTAQGRHAEAARTLEAALEAAKRAGRAPLRDFLQMALARARDAAGEHAEAAALFDEVRGDAWSPLVVDAARRHALALQSAGHDEAARRAWRAFLRTFPDSVDVHEARVRLAHLDRAAGDVADAVARYRRILREAPRSRAGDEARLALDALAEAGHPEAGPPRGEDRLAELRWLVNERRFAEARPGLEAFLEDAHEGSLRASDFEDLEVEEAEIESLALLARTLRETGETEEALALYGRIEERDEPATSADRIAWMLASLGRHDGAEATLLEHHDGRRGRRYWRDVGELRLAFGRYAEAAGAWREARRSERRRDDYVDRKIAWSDLWSGEHERAMRRLERVERQQRRHRDWARYWQARTLQEAGRTEQALQRFRALAGAEPLTYYGIQAWSRAAEIEGVAPERRPRRPLLPRLIARATGPALAALMDGPSGVATAPPAPAARTPTLRWEDRVRLPRWEDAPRPAPRAERLAALRDLAEGWGRAAPEADRALALERLGFTERAVDELRVIDTDYRVYRWKGARGLVGRGRSDMLDNRRHKKIRGGADIDHLGRRGWRSARRFGRAAKDGDFLRALRRAQRALADPWALRRAVLETGGPGSPSEAHGSRRWEATYPLAWPRPMATYSSLHRVPAYLLYGVMTVESTFHAHAVSVSHAYGALQMIPRTGRRVAEELGFEEFTPEVLLRPEVSIYMGSYYLGRLLDRFRGQEPLAAAAYNAGPHRVAAWLDAHPDRPMDVFIEEIPFRQARGYARKVLRYTARYRRTYHGEPHMYVSNDLDPRHGATPTY
ncbi:MAG: transglycosylase SLT domain-containing protein [Myxococcota bacterium]